MFLKLLKDAIQKLKMFVGKKSVLGSFSPGKIVSRTEKLPLFY